MESSKKTLDIVTPSAEIKSLIDDYVLAFRKLKQAERELNKRKKVVSDAAKRLLAERILGTENSESFQIEGNSEVLTFVLANRSGTVDREQYEEFVSEWGLDLANQLFYDDITTLRFNIPVLVQNLDQVQNALNTLPAKVKRELLLPLKKTVKKEAVTVLKHRFSEPEKMINILDALKLSTSLRV